MLSLTLVPALVAIVIHGKVSEKENFAVRGVKRLYAPTLEIAIKARWLSSRFLCSIFWVRPGSSRGWAASLFRRLMRRTLPCTQCTFQHVARPVAEDAVGCGTGGCDCSRGCLRLLETGTAEVASDPMPPSVSDIIHSFETAV